MEPHFTIYDLLAACPEEHIESLQHARKAVLRRDWLCAAGFLWVVAAEGDSTWHSRCQEVADRLAAHPIGD